PPSRGRWSYARRGWDGPAGGAVDVLGPHDVVDQGLAGVGVDRRRGGQRSFGGRAERGRGRGGRRWGRGGGSRGGGRRAGDGGVVGSAAGERECGRNEQGADRPCGWSPHLLILPVFAPAPSAGPIELSGCGVRWPDRAAWPVRATDCGVLPTTAAGGDSR